MLFLWNSYKLQVTSAVKSGEISLFTASPSNKYASFIHTNKQYLLSAYNILGIRTKQNKTELLLSKCHILVGEEQRQVGSKGSN